ncbi:carbohydrate ABC transporter permease [Nonomuraea basaltis]|uniref:carbohydrate ABC transporter permease n=1 Tax=Nonomuraea basaltis TaxID=2495887 RepID=UPI00110C44C2|nr:sugar ABC transporter permease [Nonomuraea basaltis]TMR95033.1 sugar ABC transporter permease [Nonomuraea basaltis]
MLRQRRGIALLMAPLGLFGAFFLLPNLMNLAFAFTGWSAFRPAVEFVGLDNFRDLADDGILWADLRRTLVYAAVVTLAQNGVGLVLALGLERSTRGNRALRAILFFPVLLAPLAVGYVFQAVLAYDGLLNRLLGTQVEWLGSVDWTLGVVALVHAWKWVGLTVLIYIAGLAAVPQEVLQAARIDGASGWQVFRHVKFRLLAPAVTINVTLTLIGALNTFDIVLATTRGGPGRATEVLNVYVFQQFGTGAFGQATAMSLVLFLTVVAVAVPLVVYLRRREVSG